MRKLQIFFITIIFISSVYAIPIDSLFLKIPDKLLPTLPRKQRYEMAEYFKVGKRDSVQNIFGRNAIMLKYDSTKCHIVIKTSSTGLTEIKRFIQENGDTVFALISTVQQPVKYSSIDFYTQSWQTKTINIELPSYESWIDEKQLSETTSQAAWIKSVLNKKYYSLSFTDANELFVENNVLSTLNNEDSKLVKPFFITKGITIKLKL